jgi:Xaa-Pro dipeptidase
MAMIGPIDVDELSVALRQRGLDGWLLYDFHEMNQIAERVLGETGMLTRRRFIWLPAVGPAQLVVSTIDRPSIRAFGGEIATYTTWQELHQILSTIVRGRRIAMEVSPENAVPYLDLVPSGVLELLGRFGATIVPSAPLVTQFSSRWSAAELKDHTTAAEIIAEIARESLAWALGAVGTATELTLQRRVLDAMDRGGLVYDDLPIVGFREHGADPHYEPKPATDRQLGAGDVVLLDLWGRRSPSTVWADQTWMAYAGATPPDDVARVWEAVRDARDTAVARLRAAHHAGEHVTGAEIDQVTREVLRKRGYAEHFGHRTGHSIDLGLHGSGPHLDDFETHDVRELLPGVGFSVEPGVYLPGRFGVRTEINVYLDTNGPLVTPETPQRDLIVRG